MAGSCSRNTLAPKIGLTPFAPAGFVELNRAKRVGEVGDRKRGLAVGTGCDGGGIVDAQGAVCDGVVGVGAQVDQGHGGIAGSESTRPGSAWGGCVAQKNNYGACRRRLAISARWRNASGLLPGRAQPTRRRLLSQTPARPRPTRLSERGSGTVVGGVPVKIRAKTPNWPTPLTAPPLS